MASIEEKVEEYYKKKLNDIGLRYFGKTEPVNPSIDNALKTASSKSGGTGNNYPDIKSLRRRNYRRYRKRWQAKYICSTRLCRKRSSPLWKSYSR